MSAMDAKRAVDKEKGRTREVGEGLSTPYDVAKSQPRHSPDRPYPAPEFHPPQDRTPDMHRDNFLAACIRNGLCCFRGQSRYFPEATELSTLPQRGTMEEPSQQPAADVAVRIRPHKSLSPEVLEGARQQAREQGITLFMETPPSRDVLGRQLTPTMINSFQDLRFQTFHAAKLDLEDRMRENPIPTHEEFSMGCFIEIIEPQVRDAVLELNRKGYTTSSSGFDGGDGSYQSIAGDFTLDKDTIKRLEKADVGVIQNKGWSGYVVDSANSGRLDSINDRMGSTLIFFKSNELDLGSIQRQWERVTALIPDKGEPVPPSQTKGAQEFRNKYQASFPEHFTTS